jgi:hypothetical protein
VLAEHGPFYSTIVRLAARTFLLGRPFYRELTRNRYRAVKHGPFYSTIVRLASRTSLRSRLPVKLGQLSVGLVSSEHTPIVGDAGLMPGSI